MKAATFMFVHLFFCVIILSVITQAQNSGTHNTGTLEVKFFDNGYIEEVMFNGNPDALWSAGFLYGLNGGGYGNIYHFYVDFYNVIPFAGFSSGQNFNQYGYHTLGLTQIPDSRTEILSCSNTGSDFVFFRCTLSNNDMNLDDVYPGIFADWEVGNVPGHAFNRGGYDPSRNLIYMYENGGVNDANYYGIMGIAVDGNPMAQNTIRGTISDEIPNIRARIYDLMTSTGLTLLQQILIIGCL
jgi:hypothetical protein